MTKEEIEEKIAKIEADMNSADFWMDKNKAQEIIAEHKRLKMELEGVGKYDRGDAILAILSGAGG
ncbi:MAG: peptide chain release factor 2, partial [Candidatus Taylorbacteria bacterium]|nr:peptide chain release factor 2 [Candidatus Taylorbacteria bacterium]